MALDSAFKKTKPSKVRFQNRFSTYKSSPIEENDRAMRRYETGFRCQGKPWLATDGHELDDREWFR